MKVLKSFEFTWSVRASEYDWDLLLDRAIRQLEAGTDFECKPQTMRMMLGKHARKQGKAVRINAVDGGLVVQAYERPADEETKKGKKK
jgi:hypothetical protein